MNVRISVRSFMELPKTFMESPETFMESPKAIKISTVLAESEKERSSW